MSKEIEQKADAVVELHFKKDLALFVHPNNSNTLGHAIITVKGQIEVLEMIQSWGDKSLSMWNLLKGKKAILKNLEDRL